MGFYFTYGVDGQNCGQDYTGGYTFVHAPNYSLAVSLWSAVHQWGEPYPLRCGGIYTDADMKRNGWDEDHFGVCHDTIVYQDRKEI